jgi:hypothetical protein
MRARNFGTTALFALHTVKNRSLLAITRKQSNAFRHRAKCGVSKIARTIVGRRVAKNGSIFPCISRRISERNATFTLIAADALERAAIV